jgi:hypothetical protein
MVYILVGKKSKILDNFVTDSEDITKLNLKEENNNKFTFITFIIDISTSSADLEKN